MSRLQPILLFLLVCGVVFCVFSIGSRAQNDSGFPYPENVTDNTALIEQYGGTYYMRLAPFAVTCLNGPGIVESRESQNYIASFKVLVTESMADRGFCVPHLVDLKGHNELVDLLFDPNSLIPANEDDATDLPYSDEYMDYRREFCKDRVGEYLFTTDRTAITLPFPKAEHFTNSTHWNFDEHLKSLALTIGLLFEEEEYNRVWPYPKHCDLATAFTGYHPFLNNRRPNMLAFHELNFTDQITCPGEILDMICIKEDSYNHDDSRAWYAPNDSSLPEDWPW